MHIQQLQIMNKTMDSFSPTFQWPISHGSSRWHRTKTDISIIIRRYCPALLYAIAVYSHSQPGCWGCDCASARLILMAMRWRMHIRVGRRNAPSQISWRCSEETLRIRIALHGMRNYPMMNWHSVFYTYRCLNFFLFPAHILLREKLFQ